MAKDLGIEEIKREKRHGSNFSLFTLWFAANLTLGDFALGFLPATLNLPFSWALVGLIVGTALGGILLAVVSVMGPETGKTQMLVSEQTFKRYNFLQSLLQWVNTLGWFVVNLILGTVAVIIFFHTLYYLVLPLYALVQIIIAIYGHDYIHKIERIFSAFLGFMFLYITVQILLSSHAYNYSPIFSIAMFGIVIATSFSYLGSWAPYASDYSRYLPYKNERKKVFIFTFFGSFISTIWLEVLGLYIAIKTGNFNSMGAAYALSNQLGILMIIALVLGGIGTNSINIYSNALSLNSVLKKSNRIHLLIISGIIGIFLAMFAYNRFFSYYETFLYIIDYWIMPWAGVLIADFFYVKKGSSVKALTSFLVGLAISIPFMNQAPYFEGPISVSLGGIDVSYFVSFIVSFAVYVFLSNRAK
ncbi:MAG: purine-cytosine permease family protein [Thermoplasmata archaeon]